METWHAFALIALVLGVMISNIMLIKHLGKVKTPPSLKPNNSLNEQVKKLEKQLEQNHQNEQGQQK